MNSAKYIGLDVHQATISVAVVEQSGNLLMECLLETKAATILQFLAGLRGTLHVTFEEGTCAAWLYDLLKPHVPHLVVRNPRRNALLKVGNKNDRIDARKLAELQTLHSSYSIGYVKVTFTFTGAPTNVDLSSLVFRMRMGKASGPLR